jgi:hypothetical protein
MRRPSRPRAAAGALLLAAGGVDDLTVTGTGRYVRVYGTQRALSPYGYSLWEVEVFGV